MVSVDFFTVPTIRFEVVYVFLASAHQRRRILHFGITAHPTRGPVGSGNPPRNAHSTEFPAVLGLATACAQPAFRSDGVSERLNSVSS
jgi:hypothetical protein